MSDFDSGSKKINPQAVSLALGLPAGRYRGLWEGLLVGFTSTVHKSANTSYVAGHIVSSSVFSEYFSKNCESSRQLAENNKFIVLLDSDPDEIPSAAIKYIEKFQINCSIANFDDALTLRCTHPLVIYLEGQEKISAGDAAAEIVQAGHIPGLARRTPLTSVSDFLAVVVHAQNGFLAQADTVEELFTLMSVTIAALRGEDIGLSVEVTNSERLSRLGAAAGEALRQVLLAVEVPNPVAMGYELAKRGIM
ncbi:MAG: hypothetical protein ACRCSF_06605 [Mycobacteriaceae bacterium]